LDPVREIVGRGNVGPVDPLGDLQNILPRLEVENDVVAAAAAEDEGVATRATMKHVVACAAVQDICTGTAA
jgi:hypothetical protein